MVNFVVTPKTNKSVVPNRKAFCYYYSRLAFFLLARIAKHVLLDSVQNHIFLS